MTTPSPDAQNTDNGLSQKRLALFQSVSKAVNSSLVLEDIFKALVYSIDDAIPFIAARIAIFDDTQNNLQTLIDFSCSQKQDEKRKEVVVKPIGHSFIASDPLFQSLLQLTTPKKLSALGLTETINYSIFLPDNSAQQNAIICPLLLKGSVIGSIALIPNDTAHLSPSELAEKHREQCLLLEDIASQLAIAVDNARLYWRTQNQAIQQFLLNQMTHAIRRANDIDSILKTTVREVGLLLGCSRVTVYFGETTQGEPLRAHQYTHTGLAELSNLEEWARFEQTLFEQRQSTTGRYNPFILNNAEAYAPIKTLCGAENLKSYAIFPVLDEQGQGVGAISLHQCHTQRAWLESDIELLGNIAEHLALALHQARLYEETDRKRHELQEALNTIKETQLQLIQSEKMAVLGQFVAGIAHEVNTPLGIIVANLDTIKECLSRIQQETHGQLSAETQHFMTLTNELIQLNDEAAKRIAAIVHNLRNFARLDESDRKTIDIHECIETTLNIVVTGLNKKAVPIEKHYDRQIPLISCFPGLINQVLQNILVNAFQAIQDVSTPTLSIRTQISPNEPNAIRIGVADNGSGIAPDDLSRIFEPGFTTKGVGVGTGLGLALCYRIIEKHNGRIWAENIPSNVPQQGTQLWVELPISNAE